MMSRLRRRAGEDGGFTLVELVVTVAILGIIVVPLFGVVLSYLRTTVHTAARMTESQDVQLVAAYWQRDVASIGVRSGTYDAASHSFPLQQSVDLPACALPAGATPAITLAWSEYDSLDSTAAPTTVKVTYASQPTTTGGYELRRVRCGSRPSEVRVADNLLAPPAVACVQPGGGSTCTGGGGQVPVVVKLMLQVRDSTGHGSATYIATLSGERRQT